MDSRLSHAHKGGRPAPHTRTRQPTAPSKRGQQPTGPQGRRLWTALLVCGVSTLAILEPADAVIPLPVYPQCGSVPDQDAANCPNDFGENWRYLSYIKDEIKPNIREEEWALGSGFWLDKTLAVETGDWRITIAVLDSGIEWDSGGVVNKHRLNTKELPLPQNAGGVTASSHDLNGDGIVNIQDYAQDPRVSKTAGVDVADSGLDPSDLIAVFSDGVDQDANGYVDDIAGWDFFWNDNNPYDSVRYGHGTGEANDSAEEGGDGGDIGVCPNCSLLNLRVGDSFVTDVNAFAEAVIYAADNNAQVIQEALGTVNNSVYTIDALRYATGKGLTVIASAADETSIHQNMPANNEGVVVVHAIRYDGEEEANSETYLGFENCTNYGGNLHLSISGTACSSEATGRGAGIAGLVYSAALHKGVTLTSNEVKQLLITTVDDIDVPETYNDGVRKWYPSQPGFDRYFGYGRVNVYKAVSQLLAGRIPPEAQLASPEWFQIVIPSRTPVVSIQGTVSAKRASSFTYVVEYAVGLDPLDGEFLPLNTQTRTSSLTGTLASLDLTQIPVSELDPNATIEGLEKTDTNVTRHEKSNRYTITVRVRVTDSNGVKGEDRRTLYVQNDPDLLPAYPLYLGGSMESSPKVFDLDGDGKDELIQATSDGKVYALRANGTSLTGWPVMTKRLKVLDPSDPKDHLNAAAYKSGAVSPDRGQSIVATPAIGDLDKDGKPEVVAATYDGEIYAWKVDGTLLAGFPTTLDYTKGTDANTSPDNYLEAGFFSSPALGDLDGDGYLDIVCGAMDQWVYAFDRKGKSLAGWPVLARWNGTSETTVHIDRIMTSPALGDLNRDGKLDVVIGTNEIVSTNKSPTYAIHGDGNLHAGGPYVSGWPVLTQGIYLDVLPSVGKGTQSSPALADINGDGKLEVATHSITGFPSRKYPSIFTSDGRAFSSMGYMRRDWGAYTNTEEPAGFVTINSGSFGDIDQDGDLDYALNLGGFKALLNLEAGATRVEHNYLVGAWDATTGRSISGFPQQVADMQFFMNPVIADLDGDDLPEVISGNGAFTVDAFDRLGEQPEGWPKFTGQWNIAAPAVGDMDGDGLLEVIQGTRSGYLYVWKTQGATRAAGGVVEWGSFHHDAQNTGNYGVITDELAVAPRVGVHPSEAPEATTGCSLSGASSRPPRAAFGWAFCLLAGAGLGIRRRRP